MRKILFVDDDPKVLEGLQRMLRPMRREWETAFAVGGSAALETLCNKSFDVVVTDMRMPGMDGAQLLTEVRKRHPQMVRIVLSGHADKELIMKTLEPAHQYLAKPCTAETIKETVGRACALRDLLDNALLQQLVSNVHSLPSLPTFYSELIEELRSPDPSIQHIGEIISNDIGMTAKILQMVNSSFFGMSRKISNPNDAVMLLNLDTITSLVLTTKIFSQFDKTQLPEFRSEAIWSHCLETAKTAKRIASAETCDEKIAEDSYTAGLLHEAGRIILASTLPSEYKEVLRLIKESALTVTEAEYNVFGTTHAEVGAYLLGLWGLPESVVEAVAFHHHPNKCSADNFTPLTAVHIANYLENQVEACGKPQATLDVEYIARLNMAEKIASWQKNYQYMSVVEAEDKAHLYQQFEVVKELAMCKDFAIVG